MSKPWHWHWHTVCEYGKVHARCDHTAEGRAIVGVECDTPYAHRPDEEIGEDNE